MSKSTLPSLGNFSTAPTVNTSSLFDGLSPPSSPLNNKEIILQNDIPSRSQINIKSPVQSPSQMQSSINLQKIDSVTLSKGNTHNPINLNNTNGNGIDANSISLDINAIPNVNKPNRTDQSPIIDLSNPKTPLSQLSPKSEPLIHHGISENPTDSEASVGPVRLPDFNSDKSHTFDKVTAVNIITKSDAFSTNNTNHDGKNEDLHAIQPSPNSYSPQANVEDQIIYYGYDPLGKIISIDDSNEVECRYIKAVNDRGQIVYIQPNHDSWMNSDPGDFTVTETTDPSTIPHSIRNGSFLTAVPDVCGVILEKETELCVITQSDYNMEPEETVLIPINCSTSINDDNIDELIVAYPIVKLGEIINNNDIVVKNTCAVTVKLRNTSYQTCIKNISDMKLTCNELSKNFDSLYVEIDDSFKKLAHTIRELEGHKVDFEDNPPTDENQQIKIPRIVYNLKRRHEMMIELLKMCHSANSHSYQLKQINRKFSEMGDHTRRSFESVEYDLFNDSS